MRITTPAFDCAAQNGILQYSAIFPQNSWLTTKDTRTYWALHKGSSTWTSTPEERAMIESKSTLAVETDASSSGFSSALRSLVEDNRGVEAAPTLSGSRAILDLSFDTHPGVMDVHARLKVLTDNGLTVPFLRKHDSASRDKVTINAREFINFSGYNYLGLSGHPTVSQAAQKAIDQYGTSVSASRVAGGEIGLHRELELEVAKLIGTEDAVAFVSGYSTNVTTISSLFGRHDVIYHDELIHNSALTGCVLSGARRRSFPHNDWEALDRMLSQNRHRYERALIVIEGVYSMDGDIANLPRFVELRKKHKAFLMVDEAHSLGVLGETGGGVREHFGLEASDVDLWMGTFSKSLAGCGGYIAANANVVEFLKYRGGGFLYSVGMTPPDAGAALAAIRVMRAESTRVARVRENAAYFRNRARSLGLNTGMSVDGSPVVPIIVGNSILSLKLAEHLLANGVRAHPIFYPAVEENGARLRFFVSATHSTEQMDYTLEVLAGGLQHLRTLLQD
jgi:8-amino-7-oxononanoate synthase